MVCARLVAGLWLCFSCIGSFADWFPLGCLVCLFGFLDAWVVLIVVPWVFFLGGFVTCARGVGLFVFGWFAC